MLTCRKCHDLRITTGFEESYGYWWKLCECHKICPECNGSGEGNGSFEADGKEYKNVCHKCKRRKVVRKKHIKKA